MTNEDVREIADKHLRYQESDYDSSGVYDFARAIEARVHEELRKQEPFGWWHQGDTEDESDFHLAESGAGMDCKNCIALFAHAAPIPPITPSQQEALDALGNIYTTNDSAKTCGIIERFILARPDAPIPPTGETK